MISRLFFSIFFLFKEIELLVNFRDLGLNVKEGDILEIYHPEEDEHQPRLLLQVPRYEEEVTVSKGILKIIYFIYNR